MNGAARVASEVSFQPHWALSNGHVQTVLRELLPAAPDAPLQPFSVPTPDGDALEAHLDSPVEADAASTPIVLIVHGLEGSHLSPYVRRMRYVVRAAGWRSVSMVQRSCGGRLNLAPRLYHTGDTQDLATLVRWVSERWRGCQLFVVGYSLGGNQLAKWLGTGAGSIPDNVSAAAARFVT